MHGFLSFHNVSFGYETAPEPLFTNLSVTFPTGWTGIAGANGCGKSTLLQLATGQLAPISGRIVLPGAAVYCEQRTDNPPDEWASFLDAVDNDAVILRTRLRISLDWKDRWPVLSHGERKRAQIAVALWRDPVVLAVDEPTNHLDAHARGMLLNALRSFRGIGLLVSHDRELLDGLCRGTLLMRSGQAVLRPGGYTDAAAQAEVEDDSMRDLYRQKKQTADRLAAEAARRRAEAAQADRKRSKRGLALRDHDGRSKIDAARVRGADGRAGRLAKQLDGRVEDAARELTSIRLTRRYDVNFWLPDTRAERPVLLSIPSGEIAVGKRRLAHPELTIGRDDRIALTGVNGSGKSTLIRNLLEQLTLPADRVIYLPQEIDTSTSAEVMREVNSLSRERLGHVMTIVNCLGSTPSRLVGNADVSPGELRKVLLALGITRRPWLIVMDEPTNHLDLPAVEALESALDGCPCALLLVSHDAVFLSHVTTIEWCIETDAIGARLSACVPGPGILVT
jgi:ATPase subunit of ABC transporter with duplicated ATPase domains